MWLYDMYNQNACSIVWNKNTSWLWTWDEYRENKKIMWDSLVLFDMIDHPVYGSITISEELLFGWKYPNGTTFALYCHSWWSSWYLQMQLTPLLPQYKFINIKWWILAL